MTPIFWIFEEREKLLEFCEKLSGARMHAAIYKFNNFNNNLISLLNIFEFFQFCKNFFISLNEIHNVLSYNKIWKQRLINIGIISFEDCLTFSLTGILSRSVGIKRDIRISKTEHYANYYYLNTKSFFSLNGDCYDRYLLRINELNESIFIIIQILKKLLINKKIVFFKKNNFFITMETIINHFKYWKNSYFIKKNFFYKALESPKGELGLTLVSNDSNQPWKCKLRSPGFHHLQYLQKIANGYCLSDLITLIGSIDIVFGEIDK
jgi:NADH:ubiquinone oxidoreductase subunit D